MKTQKRKNCILLAVVFCILLIMSLGLALKIDKPITAKAATEQTLYSGTTETYYSDAAKYWQTVNIIAPKGYLSMEGFLNFKRYTDGDNIRIEVGRGDGEVSDNHRLWTLTYLRLLKEVDSQWVQVGSDERIAAVCARHGGGYNEVGEGLQHPSRDNLRTNGRSKTVSEYCSNAVSDDTYVTDIKATKGGDLHPIKFFSITEEGHYKIEIIFVAFQNGNYSTSTGATTHSVNTMFYVDRTGPDVTLTGANDGFSNSSVKADFSDVCGATANYARNTDKNFPDAPSNSMSSGASFSDEGNYTIVATDKVGNVRRKEFTIDRTAPVLSLTGVVNGGATNGNVKVAWETTVGGIGAQRVNSNDALTVKYSYSKSYTPPNDATTEITSASNSKMFTDNGSYRVTIWDRAGNSSSYTFIIDTIAPTVTTLPDSYLNHSFVFSATDSYGFKGIEYKKDGGTSSKIEKDSLSVSLTRDNYGAWQFRAYDSCGNYTEWYSTNMYYRTEFGNSNRIFNGYFLPAYYVVTLPSKTFNDISGKYTFAEYSAAFDWAYKKEWEYRVIELGNNKWSYVNIANESVHQVYTDRAELNNAVSKYASSYVSDRRVISAFGGTISNPTDASGTTRDDALTVQLSELPSHLSEYSGLTYMLAEHSYEFKRPANGVADNTSTASIKFISDGISKQNGPEIRISYGDTLKATLNAASAWRQGYYLVTETDRCGNVEKYVLCIDTGEPMIAADVTLGNGDYGELEFTRAFAEQHYGTMRYLSLSFTAMQDSVDGFVMLNINGRGLDNVKYVSGDELPVLNYENGYYGDYSITVYDRSLNTLQFNVRIAGIAPTVSYTSLTNETKCTLTISLNDADNALASLKLYKVAYDGEYTAKSFDDDGTSIDVQSLVYVLRTGGKYVLEFTDMYGREVVTEPIFYMKGLPVGTLSGVKAGGLTNKDVGFTYDASCSVNLYAWQNGALVMVNELMHTTDGESSCKAEITAGSGTSYKFKYFLYVTEDMNLFTEYGFEIDCIPPQIDIQTVNGATVLPETVTPDSFYLNWAESGYTAYYYNKSSTLGSLGQERYTKESVIEKAGTYVFEITDAAKNVTEFTVTLDNVVSWTLDSPAYIRLEDGSYITKHNFTLTVNERASVWNVTSSNDFKPVNGQKIELDGTYAFHIEDVYGNGLDITLIVDNLPPVPIITANDGTALSAGSRTNKGFTVACEEDNVAITYSFANGPYAVYSGSLLDEEGIYNFRLTDRMGNSMEMMLVIDRGVNFSVRGSWALRGKDYYSRTWLSVSVDEGYRVFTVTDENGLTLNATDKLEAEGVYTVRIEDAAGNTETFKAVIDKSAPKACVQTLSGDNIDYGGTVSGAFLVYCEEEESTITYAKGTGNFSAYDGAYLNGLGTYIFKVTDFLGNSETFTVKVDLDVDFIIGGTYVQDLDGNYVSKSWLSITMREEYRSLRIESDNGYEYFEGDRIKEEGVYTVNIEDLNGNNVSFGVIIDRTAPGIELIGAEPGEKTRNDVQLKLTDYFEAYFRIEGSSEKFKLEDGRLFTEEGAYTVSAKDVAGNETFATFTIDKSVSVTPSRELSLGRIITGDVSFTFGETVTAELLHDNTSTVYSRGRIEEVGGYKLTVTDELGNVAVFDWTILESKARGYEFAIPEDYTVSVLLNGSVFTSAIEGHKIKLTDNGAYTLYFEGAEDGLNFSLELTVDSVAPAVQITQNKKYISVSDPSKDGLSYKLYKDGKEVSFRIGDNITAVGDYKLEITDDIGNTTVYNFELHYINTAGIIFIVLACAVVLAIILAIVLIRVKQRIR